MEEDGTDFHGNMMLVLRESCKTRLIHYIYMSISSVMTYVNILLSKLIFKPRKNTRETYAEKNEKEKSEQRLGSYQ
jgi:hypothetical protein